MDRQPQKPAKKKKPWRRARHRVYRILLEWALFIYTKLKYHIRVEKFARAKKEQFFVLMNNQTAFDQLFVEMAFF